MNREYMPVEGEEGDPVLPDHPHYPAMERQQTKVLGLQTSYYQMGDPKNQPLVLIHGMTTSADSYRETMYQLRDEYYLTAPDLPGFGLTDRIKPFNFEHLSIWLAAFCVQLQLTRFGLVGHSFGGVVALCFAAKYPAFVTRMALAAPPVYNGQSYPTILRRIGLAIGFFEVAARVSKSRLLVQRRVRAPFYAPERVDPAVFQRRIEDYRNARSSADALKTLAFTDLTACVEGTSVPVCLIWGEDDDVVEVEDAVRLSRELSRVRIEMIAACGHVTVAERPRQFASILRRFF